MNILEVENIRKYFATQKAVDDVSFNVSRGSIFGLLGPNGAGKTTLIRMITGIFYPDAGTINLNGKKFHPEQDVKEIGYMPEERGLYKKMKTGEQAVYLARLKGLSRHDAIHKAKEWFTRLEMQSWWNRKVEDLSKGMGQKLQFVTTVMHEPSLIILDEPFSGLDPVNSNLIKEEIFQLAKRGCSIIFSTHRMEQVEEICDHIILMNQGKKILDGTVKDVKQQFKENLFAITLETIPDGPAPDAFEIISSKEQRLVVKIKEGYRPNDVLLYYLQKDVTITGFYELLPSMNEIFIRLVEGTPLTRQFQKLTA
ncbi:MAG: ATP-binding cassette domain-containing protein [Chitinophagaceae bacterium]|nr:ATP-binding cassette domain-containing protein [Chitinophagaceae bacterium]